MRKETGRFYDIESDDFIEADSGLDVIGIEIQEIGKESSIVVLSKQQARKFARQILEMTGDEDGNG